MTQNEETHNLDEVFGIMIREAGVFAPDDEPEFLHFPSEFSINRMVCEIYLQYPQRIVKHHWVWYERICPVYSDMVLRVAHQIARHATDLVYIHSQRQRNRRLAQLHGDLARLNRAHLRFTQDPHYGGVDPVNAKSKIEKRIDYLNYDDRQQLYNHIYDEARAKMTDTSRSALVFQDLIAATIPRLSEEYLSQTTPPMAVALSRYVPPSKEATDKAWALLLDNLDDTQRDSLAETGRFFVTGGKTGLTYGISKGTQMNVWIEGMDDPQCGRCFTVPGGLPEGDVMLAQKLALECDEEAAMAVANSFTPTHKRARSPGYRFRQMWGMYQIRCATRNGFVNYRI